MGLAAPQPTLLKGTDALLESRRLKNACMCFECAGCVARVAELRRWQLDTRVSPHRTCSISALAQTNKHHETPQGVLLGAGVDLEGKTKSVRAGAFCVHTYGY
jgi:hypothetical protein